MQSDAFVGEKYLKINYMTPKLLRYCLCQCVLIVLVAKQVSCAAYI
jgi:hypothetical protein